MEQIKIAVLKSGPAVFVMIKQKCFIFKYMKPQTSSVDRLCSGWVYVWIKALLVLLLWRDEECVCTVYKHARITKETILKQTK